MLLVRLLDVRGLTGRGSSRLPDEQQQHDAPQEIPASTMTAVFQLPVEIRGTPLMAGENGSGFAYQVPHAKRRRSWGVLERSLSI